jgi:uncharacterized damage-inducible protein DinB
MEILFHQYTLIREGRKPFFQYCNSLKPQHFTYELESFGGRSIRHLLIHMVNTYHFWLGHFAGLKKTPFVKPEDYVSIEQVEKLFLETDSLVELFLQSHQPDFEKPLINTVPMRDFKLEVMPLQLFTHLITHEYHHKGQILSMSRQLGYTPIDTDLIRF